MKTTKNQTVPNYQIRVTLRYVEPSVWRSIQVPANTRLGKLHDILQDVMGWEDDHLYAFRIGQQSYGRPDPNYPSDMKNDRNVPLNKIARQGDTLVYEYDFGDGWEHDLKIEKVLTPEAGVHYPVCLEGQRACPPKDCGGPYGYANMLDAFHDPNNEEHEEIVEWMGEDFDAEAFTVETVNRFL